MLKSCQKLDQLYVSFTAITGEPLIEVCKETHLSVLDTTDVRISNAQREQNIQLEYSNQTILAWYLSLNAGEHDDSREIRDRYRDCSLYVTTRHR